LIGLFPLAYDEDINSHPKQKEKPMLKRVGVGLLAGLAGTAALTAAVVQLERKVLPFGEKRHAAFPHKAIRKAEHLFEIPRRMTDRTETTLIHRSHFAYGSLMGFLYGWLAPQIKISPWISGPLYGLALWGIGLSGWLPALGVQQASWRKSPMQAMVPILSHLAYGLAAAAALQISEQQKKIARRRRLVSV
jgi:hypothetical protein